MKEQSSNTTAKSRSKLPIILFWIATVLASFELGFGALWDFNVLNPGYVPGVMRHIGYPAYMATILGTWKVLGCAAIIAPRFRRLKEWAYAGAVFNFSGAAVSHPMAGDKATAAIMPLVFTALTLVSWWLRPESRKL